MIKNMNLTKKIMIFIGLPVIFAFCISGAITLTSVSHSVTQLTTNELTARSESTAHEIEVLFEKYLEVVTQMAANPQYEELFLKTNPGTVITSTDGFPYIKKALDNVKATDPDNIVVSWVADIDSSQFTQSDGYVSAADYVVTERGWYKDLIKKQKAFITEPYEDTATKSIIVSVVAPVYKTGTKELIGATCIDVNIDSIKSMLKKQVIGKTGYYILATGAGQVFYHPNEKYINLSVNDTKMSANIKDALTNKTLGSITYRNDGTKTHGFITAIGDTNWMVVSGLPDKEFSGTYDTVKNTILLIFCLSIIMIMSLIFFITRRIVNPLKKVVYMIEEMSRGHFKERLRMETTDEVGQIAHSMDYFADELQSNVIGIMNSISNGDITMDIILKDDQDEIAPVMKKTVETIRGLNDEVSRLVQSVKEGKLNARGNAEGYAGSWNDMITGINDLVEAFFTPINITAHYLEKISNGDVPSEITDEYYGDFNEIKNSINGCIKVMDGLLHETDSLITAIQQGNLGTRGNAAEFSGSWGTLLAGVNSLICAFVKPINLTAEYVQQISKGSIPEKITDEYYGDFNDIKQNLNNCIDVMNGLLSETNGMIESTKQGRLDVRGDSDAFSGEWGTLVDGINNLVDVFAQPIRMTSEYIGRISKGDIPEKITETYQGDFNMIKDNLNNCIDIMNGLLKETNKLIGSAQDGQLDARANPAGFTGGWEELICGVNKLVEAVVKPITEVTGVMNEIAAGDLNVSVQGEYKGEYKVLSTAVNETAHNLQMIVGEISKVIGGDRRW